MVNRSPTVVDRFIIGWEQLNPEMILATVDDEVTLIWGTDSGEEWRSKDTLSAAIEQQVRAFSNPEYIWSEGDPSVLHLGDGLVVMGVLYVSMTAGKTVHHTEMRSTFIVDGDLLEGKIVHAHFSVASVAQVVPY